MSNNDKKVCLIGDDRLTNYENRTRNGSTQVFYTDRDSRDFKRYAKDRESMGNSAEMHDKPDTINIQPPEKHYYSQLIDGVWWWVNGCSECNGEPRDWMTYVECDKHNVCVSCQKPSDKVEGSRWGGKLGWQCTPCKEAKHEAEKSAALDAMPEEHDAWDYHGESEIKCPYCALEFSDSCESADASDEDTDCPRCDNIFKVTAVHTLTFDCDRIDTGDS